MKQKGFQLDYIDFMYYCNLSSACAASFNITWSSGPPVKVIRVVPVQLVAGVSGGVTSLTLGLHHLIVSGGPGLSARPLFPPLGVVVVVRGKRRRRRFPDAVSLI